MHHGNSHVIRRPQLHSDRWDARGLGWPEWQRQNNAAPPVTRRSRSYRRRNSPRRLATHRIFRSDSQPRSRRNSAPGACSRRRFRRLSRSRNSRGWMGGTISLHRRAIKPAHWTALGRRTCSRAYRAAHAAACRHSAARRTYQRPRHSNAGNSGGKPD